MISLRTESSLTAAVFVLSMTALKHYGTLQKINFPKTLHTQKPTVWYPQRCYAIVRANSKYDLNFWLSLNGKIFAFSNYLTTRKIGRFCETWYCDPVPITKTIFIVGIGSENKYIYSVSPLRRVAISCVMRSTIKDWTAVHSAIAP